MRGCPGKILVGRQQCQCVAKAELREKCVYRADLEACTTASIAQFCGIDVVQSIRKEQRYGSKAVDDLLSCTRPREALKQLLQDDTRRDDGVAALERLAQCRYLRCRRGLVAAKRQRPDTGIDEQGQERDRSAL